MINKLKVIVVMPARNVAGALEKTYNDLPHKVVDKIILVDNKSKDNTVAIAKKLKIEVHQHKWDKGYGGSQKTLYRLALQEKADIIVMVHPDYQYDATLLPELVRPIVDDKKDMMFGSRMKNKDGALKGGMPLLRYYINRLYCFIENVILNVGFSEHFSGLRAYNRKLLQTLPFENFSDDYVFDQECMISTIAYPFRIGEISIPTRYFSSDSSINYIKGIKFLWDTLPALLYFRLYKAKIYTHPIFKYNETHR